MFRIYQINLEKDKDHVAFLAYDLIEKMQKTHTINASIYEKVFEGELAFVKEPEDIYSRFNTCSPVDYAGRSLSVSDVVEIIGKNGASAFYYCDKFGFVDVEFDASKTTEAPRCFFSGLEDACALINDFCRAEYDEPADFSDLTRVGLAHTTLTDDEIPVQVYADLKEHSIIYCVGAKNTPVHIERYYSLEEMDEVVLPMLSFEGLVYIDAPVFRATNIRWDTDDANLPTSVDIPGGVLSEEEICDYLSEKFDVGFQGFDIETIPVEIKSKKPAENTLCMTEAPTENTHWIVYSEWACDGDADSKIIGVYHSESEAKKAFDEDVNGPDGARELAEGLSWSIEDDTDTCFDAGEDGFYGENHCRTEIILQTNS